MNSAPDFQPLYKQVYRYLVTQIEQGVWRPSESLPSEQALATELGVSQGTVRKALDALAAEKLLERRQGKGTYVAEHTPESSLFKFFKLARPQGDGVIPSSTQVSLKRRAANADERRQLELSVGSKVAELIRTREIGTKPIVLETIVMPLQHFPDIDRRGELPNTLYALYQNEFGINIVTAEEELTAVQADETDVEHLKVAAGSPLLEINRVAIALGGKKVEWRSSRCITEDLVYSVSLGK